LFVLIRIAFLAYVVVQSGEIGEDLENPAAARAFLEREKESDVLRALGDSAASKVDAGCDQAIVA
jgi:hypothetical protein